VAKGKKSFALLVEVGARVAEGNNGNDNNCVNCCDDDDGFEVLKFPNGLFFKFCVILNSTKTVKMNYEAELPFCLNHLF
jgi:hypothetical protein